MHLPEEFRRGLDRVLLGGAQHVREGQARVLAAGAAELVLEPLPGFAVGLPRTLHQHVAHAAHGLADGRLGRVHLHVAAGAQPHDERVLVARLGLEETVHDRLHPEGRGRVEREAERREGVDRLVLGRHDVAAHAGAGSPEPVDVHDLEAGPLLLDVELVGLEALAVGGQDEGDALARLDRLADELADHPAGVLVRVDPVAIAVLLGLEDPQESAAVGRVTLRRELQDLAAVEVVREGADQLRVLGVVGILDDTTLDEVVPHPDRLLARERHRDGLVEGASTIAHLGLPGEGVDVLDEDAQHPVHADIDHLAALLARGHVRDEPAVAVGDDQGEDLGVDQGPAVLAGKLGAAVDRVGATVLDRDLGVAGLVVLVLATLDLGDEVLGGPLGDVGVPVDRGHVRHVGRVRAHDEDAHEEVGAVAAVDPHALLLLLPLHRVQAEVGEHVGDDTFDDVAGEQPAPAGAREEDREG